MTISIVRVTRFCVTVPAFLVMRVIFVLVIFIGRNRGGPLQQLPAEMTGPISRELRCREIPLLIVIARSEARPNAEREILAR